MDIAALSIIAGKERSSFDWQKLTMQLGGRLKILNVHANQQNAFGLVVLGIA